MGAHREENTMKAFWTGVAIMLVIAAGIWIGHDYLQARTDINDPDSTVGQAIDEALPPVQYGHQYLRLKNDINKLELMNIRTAVTLYVTNYGKNPQSLEDLVNTNCISPGAIQDTFRQDYRLREVNGQMVLMSSGTDQILGTDDDITMSLEGTMLNEPKPQPTQAKSSTTASGRSLDWYPPLEKNQPESTGEDTSSVRTP